MKRIFESFLGQMEIFSGDAVLFSEDNLKTSDRFIYSMVQVCTKLTNRHEISKDKLDECMKYEVIQQVLLISIICVSNKKN